MKIKIEIDSSTREIKIKCTPPTEKLTMNQKKDLVYTIDQILHSQHTKMTPIPYEI